MSSWKYTLEAKTREFQYKILNQILFTNKKLFRLGLIQSSICSLCHQEEESTEHLLYNCKITYSFWKQVLPWLRDNNIVIETLKETDMIFGKLDLKENYNLINHILLIGKLYIYSCRCQNKPPLPLLKVFIARVRLVYFIEFHIARERDKLSTHYQKWEKLSPLFTE